MVSDIRLVEAAARLMARIDELAGVSDVEGEVTRTFLSPAMGRANALVAGWMESAGMTVAVDGAGNLRGRLAGAGDRVLLTGSHLDTVKNAGRFDGILGVLLPIAAIELLRDEGWQPGFAVETIGFSDEEGVRFQAGCLGSKSVAGRLSEADLALKDSEGRELLEVLEEFGGGLYSPPEWPEGQVVGYVEAHIEQGPELELADCPVSVVTGINAQNRIAVTIAGRAGHAGTTPMRARLDAGVGAAEFTLAVEACGQGMEGLVATVGTMEFRPGAGNVIPGEAAFSIDVRHASDVVVAEACATLNERLREICEARGLKFDWRLVDSMRAVDFCEDLTGRLGAAVAAAGHPAIRLRSGAGHDAMVMAEKCPTSMIFVRCRGGLSHHPDEFVSEADVAETLKVFCAFLRAL